MPFEGPWRPPVRENPVEKQRLRQLCRVLESIPDEAFDLRDWARNGSCDSVACAVGWAMRDPWFREEGLGRAKKRSPAFAGQSGWRAVRDFFGLSREQAFELFHAGRYETPNRAAVLARLREFAD